MWGLGVPLLAEATGQGGVPQRGSWGSGGQRRSVSPERRHIMRLN
jgi:hypothetical protein